MKTLLLIFFTCAFAFGAENVPVLMWGSVGGSDSTFPQSHSLSKLSSDDFSDIVLKKLGQKAQSKCAIVLFMEQNLSIEDFSWQDTEGRSSFSNLENITSAASQVDFFPSVHFPLKGFKRLGYRWQNLQANPANEVDIPDVEEGVVFLVKLGDAKIEENRPALLKRHDSIIREIYEALTAKIEDVVAVYTSHHSSRVEPDNEPLVRRVRSAPLSDEAGPLLLKTASIAFYTPDNMIWTSNSSDETKKMNLSLNDCQVDNRSSYYAMKCRFNNITINVEMQFTSQGGYWKLENVYISDMGAKIVKAGLDSSTQIYAPLGFSYHCSPEVKFVNGSKALYIKRFQVQPYMENPDVFGEPYDCVSFFTAPILAGLLITLLLCFILVIGLAWIMDINTMDRFDDPKGKTITINASE